MTRPRVLVTESLAEAAIAALDEGGAEADVRTDLSRERLLGEIGHYEALIVRSATSVDDELIAAATNLKVIGRAGVGVDNVDVDAATRRGIVVVNAPQGNIISNAEHTVGLLLALVRRIPQAHGTLVGGHWDRKSFMGTELYDKTLGLIGLGRVGTLVAQRCMAFGMRVIARDPFLAPERFARLGVEQVDELDELLSRSDVISIHVQKTTETAGMIGDAELERCKDGVFIVNTARGGIIDEDALARAIKAGKVAGAALDAFATEPLESSPLFELDRVVVTPHLGGSTQEAQDKAGTMVAEQVLLSLRGEFAPHAVNVDAGRELPEHLRPYLGLAHKLGRLVSALANDRAVELEVAYHGEIADEDTRVLTLNALRGFLQPQVHEPVTFVNAPMIARDRGLGWGERRAGAEEYTDMIRVIAKREGDEVSAAGTIAGRHDDERLVEVDGRALEIALTPYMAFFRYEDRPGVVHKMSGPLAEHGINIEYMAIDASHAAGEPAIMALAVGSRIPAEVFEAMKVAAGIEIGRFVDLGD